MFTHHTSTTKLFLGLALAAVLTTGAQARMRATNADSVSVRVDTSGLDLRSESGQYKLHHRIVAAAAKLCGENEELGWADRAEVRACMKTSVEDAAPQVRTMIAAASAPSQYASSATASGQ